LAKGDPKVSLGMLALFLWYLLVSPRPFKACEILNNRLFRNHFFGLNLVLRFQNFQGGRHDIQQNDTQHKGIQHNDTQHNNTQHNDTQHNDTQLNDTQHNDTMHYGTHHNGTQHKGLICDTPSMVDFKKLERLFLANFLLNNKIFAGTDENLPF
jgi:hypothetical protein